MLGDTPIAGGGARAFVPSAEIGGVEAIAPLEAARIIAQAATAARAKAVSEGPFKKATNVSIDFGKRCVLTLAAPRKAVPARNATQYLPAQPEKKAKPAVVRVGKVARIDVLYPPNDHSREYLIYHLTAEDGVKEDNEAAKRYFGLYAM
ncbi:MAG: hypothetical protein U1E21_01270 [Reyranellaceae bacterium]